MNAEVQPEGQQKVGELIKSAAEIIADPRHVDPLLTNALHAHVARTIQTGNEGTYPALTPSYAKAKAQHFGPKPILVATGTMAGAATSDNASDSLHYVTDTEIINGLKGRSGEIASFHQWGTDVMAARPLYANMGRFEEAAVALLQTFYGAAFAGIGIEGR